MAKKCGKVFLLLMGNEDGPPETFTQVGGVIATSMTIGNELVDVSTKDDSFWRQLLAACGAQTVSISISGRMTDETKLNEMQAQALANTHKNFQLVSGFGDSFEAAFAIASFERSGDDKDAENFTATLENANDVVHTPAP